MSQRPRATATTIAVALAAVLLGPVACTKQELGGTSGKDIKALPASTVPHQLGGLTVKPEPVTKAVQKAQHSYIDAIGFYTLRKGRVVQGTLQVAHFGPEARLDSAHFRSKIIEGASPGVPAPVNVDGTSISQSLGTKSTVSVWFSKGRMVVLTVLLSYPGARGLLEQTLAALPAP